MEILNTVSNKKENENDDRSSSQVNAMSIGLNMAAGMTVFSFIGFQIDKKVW